MFGRVTPVAQDTNPGEIPGLYTEFWSFKKLPKCGGEFGLGPKGLVAFSHFSLVSLIGSSLPDLAWPLSSKSWEQEMLSQSEAVVEREVTRVLGCSVHSVAG